MKVAILHDMIPPNAPADLEDNMIQAGEVSDALSGLGHESSLVAFGPDLDEVGTGLKRLRPDMVFNLVETPLGRSDLIHLAPRLLERLHLPFTGAGARAMLCTSNKIIAKKTMAGAGLPTPQWLRDTFSEENFEPGTWLVKSVWEHGSIGIEGDSLTDTGDAGKIQAVLEDRTRKLGGKWFAERFVDGREFNLSILEGRNGPWVLPPAEIVFDSFAGRPRLVGYQAKWNPESYEYHHTPRRFDFSAKDRPLLTVLRKLAIQAWQVFKPKGWARVDFRVDRSGMPWILEINANPCLSSDAGFTAAAQRQGLDGKAVVARIISSANHPCRPLRPAA